MTGAQDWIGKVGQTWAQLADATDRSFAPVTARLLDSVLATDFDHALDVGCGAGEMLCRIAAERPSAQLTGVDISADLAAVARARCPSAHIISGDAASCTPPAPPPDIVLSRHGVMFFPEPAAAFSHLRSVAAPAARLAFSCFRTASDNAWALQLAETVGAPLAASDPATPGPFAFGRRDQVEAILAQAGWHDIAFEALDYPMVVGAGEDAVAQALAYYRRIGPAARALAEMPETERVPALVRLEGVLADALGNGVVALPAACWLVTARAAG